MRPRGTNQKETTQPFRVSGAKALLVHEDPGDLQYYFNMFEGYGYRVRACNSFQEGVRCLADEVFDFVMVSQGSPNFEGSRVLERAIEINRSLPILVVARCLDMDCYMEAMQLGAVDYLLEPLTVSEIGRVLENHLPVQSIAA